MEKFDQRDVYASQVWMCNVRRNRFKKEKNVCRLNI